MKTPSILLGIAASLAALALSGCEREADRNGASVGQKLDTAVERTRQELAQAGEMTREKIEEAREKIPPRLDAAGDRIADATRQAAAEVRETLKPERPAAGNGSGGAQEVTTTVRSGEKTAVGAAASADRRSSLADAAITASIKADLLKDPDLSVLKIDVDTRDGVVTLNGLAENEAARRRAEQLAGAIKGVREVRNHLVVKKA